MITALGHNAEVKDWVAWHAAYDDPSSPLSARLRRVRSHLSDAIDQAPAGRVSPGASVIWTRHRRPPDLTSQLRAWFSESGFEEIAFDALETDGLMSVGVNRLRGAPAAGLPGHRLFTFRAA